MQNLFPNQAPAQFRYLSGPSATVLATVTVSATRLDWFFRGVYPLDLGDQPIAPAGHGLDIFRLFRGVAESSTQRSNGNIDGVVEVDCRVVGPQTLPDLLAGCHLAVALNEQAQHLEWLFLEHQGTHAFRWLDWP
jgi:hypothetical protein